jgi:hypothetical protein
MHLFRNTLSLGNRFISSSNNHLHKFNRPLKILLSTQPSTPLSNNMSSNPFSSHINQLPRLLNLLFSPWFSSNNFLSNPCSSPISQLNHLFNRPLNMHLNMHLNSPCSMPGNGLFLSTFNGGQPRNMASSMEFDKLLLRQGYQSIGNLF